MLSTTLAWKESKFKTRKALRLPEMILFEEAVKGGDLSRVHLFVWASNLR
jgi:hypothetical protein